MKNSVPLSDVAPDFHSVLSRRIEVAPLHPASAIERMTVMVPMRDGVRLATEIFLPPVLPAPAIAQRTPYNRLKGETDLYELARHGYAVISQDVRGTGDSEPSSWDFYIHEWEDGYDFVDWVTKQEWYGGFLGSFGASYTGGTQFGMASHPGMTATAPEVSGLGVAPSHGVRFHMLINSYSKSVGKGKGKVAIHHGEMERLMLDETLATGYFSEPLDQPAPAELVADYPGIAEMPSAGRKAWLWRHYNTLPPAKRAALIKRAIGSDIVTFTSTTQLNPIFGHAIDPDALMYPRISVADLCRAIRAPGLLITGWYDWCLGDTLETFQQLDRHGEAHVRDGNRLLITPSAHNGPGYVEGIETHPELNRTYRADDSIQILLHYYGVVRQGRIADIPPVTYYLMGAYEWRAAASWPPPEARTASLYLGAGGALSSALPTADAAPASYIYDPQNPTPTLGGSILSYVMRPGSADIQELHRRSDVLTYTTPPLQADLDVAGPLRLVLFASSSALDTDFYGRLSDVFPDGRAITLQNGVLRARYRRVDGEPELLEPDHAYRLEIDMWATANRFKAGNRLRLDISSADFPKFERNDNRGGEPGGPIPALQTIFHDAERPSHLILSITAGALPD
ncbi:CocE/NonD family hydrolase [Allorhizobium pseudoryzae]|uniref:CocE/NonD family hydrolase n=1 Tax=Allorhizobium pseudoryzae TaxID=379684 RepID=UPI003D06ECBE